MFRLLFLLRSSGRTLSSNLLPRSQKLPDKDSHTFALEKSGPLQIMEMIATSDTSNVLDTSMVWKFVGSQLPTFWTLPWYGDLLEVSWKFVGSRNFHDLEKTRFFQCWCILLSPSLVQHAGEEGIFYLMRVYLFFLGIDIGWPVLQSCSTHWLSRRRPVKKWENSE